MYISITGKLFELGKEPILRIKDNKKIYVYDTYYKTLNPVMYVNNRKDTSLRGDPDRYKRVCRLCNCIQGCLQKQKLIH